MVMVKYQTVENVALLSVLSVASIYYLIRLWKITKCVFKELKKRSVLLARRSVPTQSDVHNNIAWKMVQMKHYGYFNAELICDLSCYFVLCIMEILVFSVSIGIVYLTY